MRKQTASQHSAQCTKCHNTYNRIHTDIYICGNFVCVCVSLPLSSVRGYNELMSEHRAQRDTHTCERAVHCHLFSLPSRLVTIGWLSASKSDHFGAPQRTPHCTVLSRGIIILARRIPFCHATQCHSAVTAVCHACTFGDCVSLLALIEGQMTALCAGIDQAEIQIESKSMRVHTHTRSHYTVHLWSGIVCIMLGRLVLRH